MTWELKSKIHKGYVLLKILSKTESPVRFGETVRVMFPFAKFKKNSSGSELYVLFPTESLTEIKKFLYCSMKFYGMYPLAHSENLIALKSLWSSENNETHAIAPSTEENQT